MCGYFSLLSLLLRFLVDYTKHLSLDSLFLHLKPVFVPNEIWSFCVNAVSLHASFEKTNDITVVWILSEGKTSAVVHELLELVWLVFA